LLIWYKFTYFIVGLSTVFLGLREVLFGADFAALVCSREGLQWSSPAFFGREAGTESPTPFYFVSSWKARRRKKGARPNKKRKMSTRLF